MKAFAALASLAALAACATMPVSGPTAPAGPSTIPSSPLELGEWRSANAAQTLAAFENNVTNRYGEGVALSAVNADLRRHEFSCGPAPRADNGRGAPPAQVCRRTITANSCTHTWQVHLFDEGSAGRLARTRSLYDRRCGSDGLLGGPG
jgi:hypothetical protein